MILSMSKLDKAMEMFEEFNQGKRSFIDLELAAVYEMPFYLQYPISEKGLYNEDGKTIQEVEEWLNGAKTYGKMEYAETMSFMFMGTIMEDVNDEYTEEVKIAVGNGLVKQFTYQFDDNQSGKLYVETTKPFTEEEQDTVQHYLEEEHNPERGYLCNMFNAFLNHNSGVDVFNTQSDTEQRTKFHLSEIPLATYLSRIPSEQNDFTKAVEDLSTDENMSL